MSAFRPATADGKVRSIESVRYFPGGMEASRFTADGATQKWLRVTEGRRGRVYQLWTHGGVTTRRTTMRGGHQALVEIDFQSDERSDVSVVEDLRCYAGPMSQLPVRQSLEHEVATRAFTSLDRYSYLSASLACPPTSGR